MAAALELDRRALLERGFADAPSVHGDGIRLADIGAGRCQAAVDAQPHHLQQAGVGHAGLLTTLADHCAGAAVFTQAGAGAQVLTTDLGVSLLRAADGCAAAPRSCAPAGRCRSSKPPCGRATATAKRGSHARWPR